ncbi:hypothetical protein JYU34_013696 [Plutella xylostella]|uniref:Uncharacterized protein n=1 Tax=Plutella xylostella TaxID=51655 RepID=A0ABQ7QAG3_PLUXY|nr:hypothetical protein JYU34_013696 [Plutella xylostella]
MKALSCLWPAEKAIFRRYDAGAARLAGADTQTTRSFPSVHTDAGECPSLSRVETNEGYASSPWRRDAAARPAAAAAPQWAPACRPGHARSKYELNLQPICDNEN